MRTESESQLRAGLNRQLMIFVVVISIMSPAILITRQFLIPTDGWFMSETTPTGYETSVVFEVNIMGAPSDLAAGDVLIAVDDVPYKDITGLDTWRAGNTVTYTVQRGERVIDVAVPLTHWDVLTWVRFKGVISTLSAVIGILFLMGIAIFTWLRVPANKAAQALVILAAMFVLALPVDIPGTSVGQQADTFSTYGLTAVIFLSFTVLFPSSLLRFALVFPRPKPIVIKKPWVEYLPYYIGLVTVVTFVFTNGLTSWIWTLISFVGALVILIHNGFTMTDKLSRAQMRWAIGGFGGGLILMTVSILPTFGLINDPRLVNLVSSLANFGYVVIGASLSIAILRYRLYDIDLIIRRTLIYTLVTIMLGATYYGGVTILQALFARIIGEQSAIAIVISTLAIAALFNPLRNRVQRTVDRRFFRASYDAQQTLERFNESVRDKIDIDDLEHALLEAVSETMQPDSIRLWIKDTL